MSRVAECTAGKTCWMPDLMDETEEEGEEMVQVAMRKDKKAAMTGSPARPQPGSQGKGE